MTMTNKQIFINVFTIDGVDIEEKTFNGVSYYHEDPDISAAANARVGRFAYHHLSLFAAFLGLPHRLLVPSQQQSMLNLAKNFIGWRDTVSLWKNILTVPFMTVMNLIITPFKFLFNLVKIFTELLPRVISARAVDLTLLIRTAANETDSFPLFTFYSLGWISSYTLAYAAEILSIIGAQLTSPNLAIRNAYKAGKNFGGLLSPGFGFVAGICVASISLMNTVTIYLLFMPIGLKFVAAQLPSVVAGALNNVGNLLEPFLRYLTGVLMQLSWIDAPYSAGFALSGVIAIATLALGKEARMLSNKFKVWWHSPETQAVVNQNVLPADLNPQPEPEPQPVNAQPQQQMQAFHLPPSSQPLPVPVATVSSAPPVSPLRAASVFSPATVVTGVYVAESSPQGEPTRPSI